MTTINDIGDLARILREQPEWADAIRGVLLSKELLDLPRQFARLVDLFDRMESRQDGMETRLGRMESKQDGMETRLDRVEDRLDRIEARLDRLEGRVGNLEGSDYERKIRYRVLARVRQHFDLEEPYLGLTQNDPEAPSLSRAITSAVRSGSISSEESEDLHDTDLIIMGLNDHHVAVEVSMTADSGDIARVKRRAVILGRATGHVAMPALATANLAGLQREQAAAEDVAVFVIPYP